MVNKWLTRRRIIRGGRSSITPGSAKQLIQFDDAGFDIVRPGLRNCALRAAALPLVCHWGRSYGRGTIGTP
jgi:hypothetical protein